MDDKNLKNKENDFNYSSHFSKLINENVDYKMKDFQEQIEKFKLQIGNMQIQQANILDKFNFEKNPNYIKFINSTGESFSNIFNQIILNKNDFINYKNKVDKLLQEIFDVPKLIGDKMKFKNLNDYIEVHTF